MCSVWQRYRGNCREGGLLEDCPFLQLVRGKFYELEETEEEKSQGDFTLWNCSISSFKIFLCCLFFPLICLHINAPNLPGHRNTFLKVLLHLKTQRIMLCFGNQVLTSAWCQFCCGMSCSAVYSCRLWTACEQLNKAAVEHLLNRSLNMSFYNCISVSSFPHSPLSQSLSLFLSALPPRIIPVTMCQCNFGVQDVSSL